MLIFDFPDENLFAVDNAFEPEVTLSLMTWRRCGVAIPMWWRSSYRFCVKRRRPHSFVVIHPVLHSSKVEGLKSSWTSKDCRNRAPRPFVSPSKGQKRNPPPPHSTASIVLTSVRSLALQIRQILTSAVICQ